MKFEDIEPSDEINALWQSKMLNKQNIRKSMIIYASKMKLDEMEYWKNPFRKHLDMYDEALLILQKDLVKCVIDNFLDKYNLDVRVSSENVLSKMVDAITDEDSEETINNKPIVFDAKWIDKYLESKFQDQIIK